MFILYYDSFRVIITDNDSGYESFKLVKQIANHDRYMKTIREFVKKNSQGRGNLSSPP
jgi:hypothetical protein